MVLLVIKSLLNNKTSQPGILQFITVILFCNKINRHDNNMDDLLTN